MADFEFDEDDEGTRGLDFDVNEVAPMGAEFDAEPVYRSVTDVLPPVADIGPSYGGDALWDEHSEMPFYDDLAPFGGVMTTAPVAAATPSPFADAVAPPVPPFVRLEHTAFALVPRATATPATAALEELKEAFAARGVRWELKEKKCKLKCTALAMHELLTFDVRVYDASACAPDDPRLPPAGAAAARGLAPGETSAPHVVEFQRKEGCQFAFGELFCEISRALRCCALKPAAPLARAPPTASDAPSGENWAVALGAAGATAPAAAAAPADDAAVCAELEAHAEALEAFVKAPRAPDEAARARAAARALAARAQRHPAGFAKTPKAWDAVRKVLSAPADESDAAVRVGAVAVVAHLAVARCGAADAPARIELAKEEADGFARMLEPLLAMLKDDECLPARAEAARAIAALVRAFPSTLRSSPHALAALQSACTQSDDAPLRKQANLALERLVAAC